MMVNSENRLSYKKEKINLTDIKIIRSKKLHT